MTVGRVPVGKVWKIMLLLPIILFLFDPFAGASDENDAPAAVVEKLNVALLKAMEGGSKLGFQGRYQLLEPVVEEVFAVETMTRISVGKYWDGLTPEERKTLSGLYAKWSASVFAGHFNTVAGRHFEIIKSEVAGNRADVYSRLVKKDQERVFLYKLSLSGGKWQIVDIHVQGVSQLANTRAQFTSKLNHGGYAGLIQSLKEKIQVLAAGGKEEVEAGQ